MQSGSLSEQSVMDALHNVADPEIPSVSVVDLGIVTKVDISETHLHITITPTFVGCPAIDVMKQGVFEQAKQIAENRSVVVTVDYSTPWNSNRVSEAGKKALLAHGLAPPPRYTFELELTVLNNTACPFCGSSNTTLKSAFGPTLCRSLHYCNSCQQGFEGFKPL
jgi:ring-1,2-phenylacetyl-CoA epoxidase subunit PaaD